MGGIEAALIIALRIGISRGTTWPVTLMAVLAALFLALGVLRHYWDIYIHRTVRGISFIFVGIDAMGDLTSLVSVFFQPKLDIRGMIIYAVELTLWIGVFACGGYYNLVPWMKRKVELRRARGSAANDHSSGEADDEDAVGVGLHDLPSSTSVFRTPSGDVSSLRVRMNGVTSSEDNGSEGV